LIRQTANFILNPFKSEKHAGELSPACGMCDPEGFPVNKKLPFPFYLVDNTAILLPILLFPNW
jgi:hypothetical protein